MASYNIIPAATDTVGVATAEGVHRITSYLINALPQIEIGVHLHATQQGWKEKVAAAFNAGCQRFDGALKGIGGCPMANSALVGNMNTEWLLHYFEEKNVPLAINKDALQKSLQLAGEIFV